MHLKHLLQLVVDFWEYSNGLSIYITIFYIWNLNIFLNLNTGKTHSLTLKSIKPEDAGTITFMADRVASTAMLRVKGNNQLFTVYLHFSKALELIMSKCKTNKLVAELPVHIMRPLRVKTAMYKHRALLECQVSRASAEVTWYKRSREIATNGKYQVVSEGVYRQLIIDEVGSSDEDIFICDAGDDKTSCQLFVEGEILMAYTLSIIKM